MKTQNDKPIMTFEVCIDSKDVESGEMVVEVALMQTSIIPNESWIAPKFLAEFEYKILNSELYTKDEISLIWEEINKYEESNYDELAWYAGIQED